SPTSYQFEGRSVEEASVTGQLVGIGVRGTSQSWKQHDADRNRENDRSGRRSSQSTESKLQDGLDRKADGLELQARENQAQSASCHCETNRTRKCAGSSF